MRFVPLDIAHRENPLKFAGTDRFDLALNTNNKSSDNHYSHFDESTFELK